MEEMTKYRNRIERRYRTDLLKLKQGRRKDDHKKPSMFYWSDLWFIAPLILSGLAMVFLAGCTVIKRLIRGI